MNHNQERQESLITCEVLRMLRELKGWTHSGLARRSRMNVRTVSELENDRIVKTKRDAELLGRAFAIHPAISMFPEYDVKELKRAALEETLAGGCS